MRRVVATVRRGAIECVVRLAVHLDLTALLEVPPRTGGRVGGLGGLFSPAKGRLQGVWQDPHTHPPRFRPVQLRHRVGCHYTQFGVL